MLVFLFFFFKLLERTLIIIISKWGGGLIEKGFMVWDGNTAILPPCPPVKGSSQASQPQQAEKPEISFSNDSYCLKIETFNGRFFVCLSVCLSVCFPQLLLSGCKGQRRLRSQRRRKFTDSPKALLLPSKINDAPTPRPPAPFP